LITAYQKWYNIPEWGDGITKETPHILPPNYLKYQIRNTKYEMRNMKCEGKRLSFLKS
jgi:hypothetical protein